MNLEALSVFLLELKMNNHKSWFDENRDRYESLRAAFYADLQTIIDGFASYDPVLAPLKAKDCAFRINKRFPDADGPYKTTFSAHFTEKGRGPSVSGYYFEISAGGVIMVGGGWYQPAPAHLAWIHTDIAAHPEKITRVLEAPDFVKMFGGLGDYKAKKLPKEFQPDHPAAELLKQKSYVVGVEADVSAVGDDLPGYVTARFKPMTPLIRYLRTLQETAPEIPMPGKK